MAVQVTARKMTGGPGHEHIASVKWTNDQTGASDRSTRAQMVEWLDRDPHKNVAYVLDAQGNKAYVRTRHPSGGAAYIQTRADETWTDNLLALPTFD